jgi:hypothetical protein
MASGIRRVRRRVRDRKSPLPGPAERVLIGRSQQICPAFVTMRAVTACQQAYPILLRC